MTRTLTPLGWAAAAALLILALVLGYCAVTRPSRDATRKAEASQTLAEGRTGAAQDASAVRDANDTANQSTRNEVEEAQDAIRREDDPAVRDRLARDRLACLQGLATCTR